MSSNKTRFARRTLLAGLGTAAAGALLKPVVAHSQTGLAPQRLLLIHRPCGSVPKAWWPQSGGLTDWVASPLLASFDKLRNDMVVMRGVDCPRIQDWLGNKPAAGMIAMMAPPPKDKGPDDLHVWPVLPGFTPVELNDPNGRFITSTDMTIDQLFLQKVPQLRRSLVPSLQLTASLESANSAHSSCDHVVSYSKLNPAAQLPTPLWPEARPNVVLQNLFGTLMGMSPDDVAKRQALNKSMLDFLRGDLNRIRPRLPASEVPKIDAHLDALRTLELQLAGAASRACVAPTLGALPTATGQISEEDARYLECCKQQSLLIKTAFQCDLTRVISFTFGCYVSPLHFINILPPGTIQDAAAIGDISHNGGTGYLEAQQATEKFFCDTTASLLLDLKNTPDGTGPGSLLDNTLVVFWNECSVGNTHSMIDMPILAFGGKFLNLQGGKYLQYGQPGRNDGNFWRNYPDNRTMADFWVATAQAWGYSQMKAYGDAMWNKGPMTGLYG
jgi:hypothetical protein